MATGGFSTRNASLGGFGSSTIEYTVTFFMFLAGTNFTLLYLTLLRQPGRLLGDPEWRTYLSIILVSTLLVMGMGIWVTTDFNVQGDLSTEEEYETAFRDGLFQVVAMITTTGFGTADFDLWNSFSRALLIVLMFVGGCAGSTGGGMKVIRHILFIKILGREIERSYHPSVVRHIRLRGEALLDPDLPRNILVYFGLVALIFGLGTQLLVGIEPDSTWVEAGQPVSNKLADSASAVAATLHNIGPGIGIVGPTRNYAPFTAPSKLLFTFLMMLGRLELFAILVLVVPGFWRVR